MNPDEYRQTILATARGHREDTASEGKEMMHVVIVNRDLRNVALLFSYDVQPLMGVAEVVIAGTHADSTAFVTDSRGRMAPKRKLNPLTGKPLPGEMTDEELQAYISTNPFTGKRWQPGEMQKLADQGKAKEAGLRDCLIVMYFARPNVSSAGQPFQWAMPYDIVNRKVVWDSEDPELGQANMGGWIYRTFMKAFRLPDPIGMMMSIPEGQRLAEGLSPEAQQAHADAAALKFGLARIKPGTVMGAIPIYEEDHPDRVAVLTKTLEPEQLQRDVTRWARRMRAESN